MIYTAGPLSEYERVCETHPRGIEVGSPGLVCEVGSPWLVLEVGSPGLVFDVGSPGLVFEVGSPGHPWCRRQLDWASPHPHGSTSVGVAVWEVTVLTWSWD